MISRRKFLSLFAATIPLGVGAWWLAKYQKLIRSSLLKKLHYLDIEEDSINKFSKDFIKEYPKSHLVSASIYSVHYLEKIFGSVGRLSKRLDMFEEIVCDRFIRGSDFFISGMDEKKKVHYLYYPDPYKTPCNNPFARY